MVLSRISVIVFDYDGTLVNSNQVKEAAYRPLFPAGKKFDELLAAALKKFPVGPRTAVIQAVFERGKLDSAKSESKAVQIENLLRQYDQEATEGAASCSIRPGALDAMQKLSEHYSLYLLSATPQDSIERILHKRKCAHFFKQIYGWPNDKTECLKQIADIEGVRTVELLMIGDHPYDEEAADKAGALSILLKPDENLKSVLKTHKII